MTFEIILTRNAYSPSLLAKELEGIASVSFIRKQIREQKLKAHRLGGRNLIILRVDAEKWLQSKCATDPTHYHKKVVRTPWPTPQTIGQEDARERRRRKK